MPITYRSVPGFLAMVTFIMSVLVGCSTNEAGRTLIGSVPPPLSPTPTVSAPQQPIIQPTPTIFELGPLVEVDLEPHAAPVDVPLVLEIPALKVSAPVVAVGLDAQNAMDAPKGPIGDAIWHTAFWYRGGGIPGQVGTATIAAHVNDPLGNPEIFAKIEDLRAGDLIIIHLNSTSIDIRFIVDQVKVYSLSESSDPQVLTRIYGAGPVAGTAPQAAPDGLSHLTLITCAGYIVNGEFDHHTVVYATRK